MQAMLSMPVACREHRRLQQKQLRTLPAQALRCCTTVCRGICRARARWNSIDEHLYWRSICCGTPSTALQYRAHLVLVNCKQGFSGLVWHCPGVVHGLRVIPGGASLGLTRVPPCRAQLHKVAGAVQWVPLLGSLATRGLELLEGIQQYYVYTSAS